MVRTARHRVAGAIEFVVCAAFLAVFALSACDRQHPAAGPRDSVTPQGSTAAAYDSAITELKNYLATWASQGAAAAAERYLVTDQQISAGDNEGPRLRAGSVKDFTSHSAASLDNFTLLVTLTLEFDGTPHGNWAEGDNTRFVTFTRTQGDPDYRMSFATGP